MDSDHQRERPLARRGAEHALDPQTVGCRPGHGAGGAGHRPQVVGTGMGQRRQYLLGVRAGQGHLRRQVIAVLRGHDLPGGGERSLWILAAAGQRGAEQLGHRTGGHVHQAGHRVQVTLPEVAKPVVIDPLHAGDVGARSRDRAART